VTALVYLLSAGLLVLALNRKPQAITVTLAIAWLVAVVLEGFLSFHRLLPFLLALDAVVVVVMGWLYRRYRSDRAQIVMALGALKVTLGIGMALGTWNVFAAAYNASFFAQVLVAGGMADGITAWLGYRLRGVCRRVYGVRSRIRGVV
jgi:hypothetical protein